MQAEESDRQVIQYKHKNKNKTRRHLGEGDGLDGLAGVAAGRGVPLHAGLGAQRVQVDAHHCAPQPEIMRRCRLRQLSSA